MRLTPVQGTVLFFVLAPGTVAGLIPWLISGWAFQPAFLHDATRFFGAALFFAALDAAFDCFARFALFGEGTPAPTHPTRRLIITGYYAYVRNPMYLAVLAAIVGQAFFFGDPRLLAYAALLWPVFHAFVAFYEEPSLGRKFAADYADYKANVPRWLPRLTPWPPLSVS